jgi:hypothetical protein
MLALILTASGTVLSAGDLKTRHGLGNFLFAVGIFFFFVCILIGQ